MFLQRSFRPHALPQRTSDERIGAGQDEQWQHEQTEDQQDVVALLVVDEYGRPQFSALVVTYEMKSGSSQLVGGTIFVWLY